MSRKIVLPITLIIVLFGMLGVNFIVQEGMASGTIHIRANGYVEGTAKIERVGEYGYIFTDNINDSIVVERDNIVVDGAGYTLQGTGAEVGISGGGVNNVTIKNLEIKAFYMGINFEWTGYSRNNTISGNNITNTDYGIYASHYDTISGNNITNSDTGISVGCSGVTISGNNLVNNSYAISFTRDAHDNYVFGNNISNNTNSIHSWGSYNNTIYHNNFINNTYQPPAGYESSNTWHDGYPSGGNYWSDYTGVDEKSGPNQDQLGSDGIGDALYLIDANNTDHYPLMGMFSSFNATSEHYVQTICNSLISEFQHNGTAISFDVTGENGTDGFCRICIPTALMSDTYHVFVNGTEVSYDLLPFSNSTHSYLYFTYDLSTKEIIIIPELQSLLIIPLFTMATLLTAILLRKRKHL